MVNNAGYGEYGPIEETDLARVRTMFETNVFGLSRLTQLVLPGMRRAGAGRIVNIGSMGGRIVFPNGGYYHATKYAVEAISDALRVEVRPFGVDVVLVEPGLIRTSFESRVNGLGHVRAPTVQALTASGRTVGAWLSNLPRHFAASPSCWSGPAPGPTGSRPSAGQPPPCGGPTPTSSARVPRPAP
jgi:short-subunit dehydrogenase